MGLRRPDSMHSLAKRRSSAYDTPPPFLPPRRPYTKCPGRAGDFRTASSRTASPTSIVSRPSSSDDAATGERDIQLPSSQRQERHVALEPPSNIRSLPHNPRLHALRTGEYSTNFSRPPTMSATPLRRHSSLRTIRRPSDEDGVLLTVHPALLASPSAPCLRSDQPRPHSHPPSRSRTRFGGGDGDARGDADAWQAEPLPPPSPIARPLLPRPRASFQRLLSLDNLISYREKKAEWKRESTLLHDELPNPEKPADNDIEQDPALVGEDRRSEASDDTIVSTEISAPPSLKQRNRFRSLAAEIGFAFTMASTAFLGEYLLSGIAIALPDLLYRHNLIRLGPGTLGTLWPASLLSLILSATLLVFARLADMYGGYGLFMAGLIWLGVWTLIPGLCTSELILDVARAMQGLAIAAFMPSTFVMVDSFYQAGPRRNFVLGLYSGCAPLGFFAGFLTAAALPSAQISWYFYVSSIVAFTAAITAYLTVPHDRTDRKQLGLKMDWLGAFLITAGLILVSYALAYEPSADMFDRVRNGFSYPEVYGPFSAAWCVECWYAKCPLLPFEFFKPRKSTTALCFANLCFYASYGVWLYESVDYFQSPTGVTKYEWGVQGIELAIWYTPTAVGGLVLCVVGASLLRVIRMEILMLLSGLAWIAAPLLLAVCPRPLNYWAVVIPSMICATCGIDITYTVSLVHISSTQPKKYQGLCGAMCSIMINLGMAFSLPISEIIQMKAGMAYNCDYSSATPENIACSNNSTNWGFEAMFLYAAASAGLGFIVCALFVRFPRTAAKDKPADEERPRETSSESPTLVEAVARPDLEVADDVESVRETGNDTA
ncbi:hypothetical protein LTR91_005027 [Friedmanniomyces endolithicus]|uniref:Major facilitator superfamily (MFS) profile domain-containing protein n=1 Tax=Friedmanniomyces endolithicus TaxID=329885 RepID=A0AAN6KTZ4_9PEZI|nr:hypothetical protein LTR94_001753 [Friedmanniomyces endolithicus]KAK0786833.1 hypothetical protein LTR38_011884 [Friedmanniomyces endolithicus]KAK0807978.1 hypothetical protein LTR59_003037 [Friedmanniomyces endolithicus]KAK0820823.1 hypothetical protein LTR75_001409 [Friedmanniomyces endolithicus]KAK0878726.1 hypothetical protein LTR87_007458 [Friedmanniomyces endolithicus]